MQRGGHHDDDGRRAEHPREAEGGHGAAKEPHGEQAEAQRQQGRGGAEEGHEALSDTKSNGSGPVGAASGVEAGQGETYEEGGREADDPEDFVAFGLYDREGFVAAEVGGRRHGGRLNTP